ncbi:hypothetical protein KEJ34_03530 [Candidatus Bathyarchaeota archaeon]|nr:hypothetical protein [Candidatus Bathyarchaeota archaeon]
MVCFSGGRGAGRGVYVRFVAKFQNPNGGFRRSVFLGISDFESTYQALSSIEVLLSSSGLGRL